MQRSRKLFIGKCLAIFSAVPIVIFGFAEGPLPHNTGAPGDTTCVQSGCHIGTALNGGGGNVKISFSTGSNYTPGQRLTVTINITDSKARVYGFQASSRDSANKQIGTFNPAANEFVQCDDGTNRPAAGCPSSSPIEFIQHMSPFQTSSISFDWTAPATNVGPITFYVAANAANGDRNNTGDHIYTTSGQLTPAASTASLEVTNGASFQPGIQAGSWVTIKGANLATKTRIWRGDEIVNGVLPKSLEGTSVNIGGKPAAVYFISPTQINVQAPDLDGQTGNVPVEVFAPGGNQTTTAVVQTESPAFFMFDPENRKYIAALTQDNKLLGKIGLFDGARPAHPGEVVQLFGTGFGPTNPPVPALEAFSGAAPTATPVTATIGGKNATVAFAGVVGAGLYQVNIVVPSDLPNGDYAVVTTVNGVSSPSNSFITVQAQ